MKVKFIVPIALAILMGYLFGSIIYREYKADDINNKVYFLQKGKYKSKVSLVSNMVNNNQYLTLKENNNYYLYIGITKNYDKALKIKKIYKDAGYNLYIKEARINNIKFLNELYSYDKLINSVNNIGNLKQILKASVNCYEKNIINK